ncbi:hypothetical protein I6F30_11700 [Bradyrhizobium sp. NBAIM20]|uniref:hypothetical protein n=1 Tax=unclassified Bradyrhizobium TaxID=2631580 RepID=UPI001CD3C466|nr:MULTISPECIES: hypothetical protein [unclassified Bradyrhizobium]MCA1411800.1 hypothetical protein [Bradyrhizobium sp. NBAIM20]MCA1464413.1 hypothetical protein [Bradyrhizobium sp. NBAIM18]
MRGGKRDVVVLARFALHHANDTQRDWAGPFIRVRHLREASQSARAEFLASLVSFVTFVMIGAAFPARMRRASARDCDVAVNTCGFLRISGEFREIDSARSFYFAPQQLSGWAGR